MIQSCWRELIVRNKFSAMRAAAILCVFISLQAGLCAVQEQPVPQPKPPTLPFIDRGACPFEGCQYGPWTATKRTTVYDNWEPGHKTIALLAIGEKITGITGVVITYVPGVVRLDRDLPEFGLKRGGRILTYAYRGEGTSAVWFNGRYYSDFDLSFARGPEDSGCHGNGCAATYVSQGKKVWWAQVKLKSGRTGWVNMNEATFDGVDALG